MKHSFFIIFLSIIVCACNKQIDAIRPLTQIDQEGELSSVAGVVEATVGNYSLLRDNAVSSRSSFENATIIMSETRGNNVTLRTFAPNISREADPFYFRNSNGPTLGYSNEYFLGSYQIIVGVNTVLEGIEKMEENLFPSFTEADRNNVLYAKGENKFLRALTFFNLVRLYGKPYYQNAQSSTGISLKLTSALTDNPEPSTVKEVYDFVVSELQAAAQLMKVPVSKTNSFASTAAAWALLSRVYLYMGGTIDQPDAASNQLSIAYADSVLNESGSKYDLLQGNDYKNLFADDKVGGIGRANFAANKEIIFAFDNATGYSVVASLFNYDELYGLGAEFVPSAEFKQLLTPQDIRSEFLITNPGAGLEETTKYLVLYSQFLSHAPFIYFRTGEIYLNRAEAYAKVGDFDNARTDLRTIHTRAGLPGSDIDAISDANLLAAILKERRIELAFEGHGSYDYFRNGLPMIRSAADNNGTELIIQPDDAKVTFTIPTN